MRRGNAAAVSGVLLLALALGSQAASECAAQLDAAAAASGSSISTFFLDADTPGDACTKQMCTGDYATCDADAPPLNSMQLVFSDEFGSEGRAFGVEAADPRWTADRMWYAGTDDMEVYAPEQVTTTNGSVVITIERSGAQNATVASQQPDGVVWTVEQDFKSGFVSSWNKFCFTGGYMETRLQLPGDDFASGFWPAFWLMGNLGRAGHMQTTSGFWPYTYNTCGGGDVGMEFPDGPTPQNISACPDPPGFDRTKFGMRPGQGRGAPEIDLIEAKVDSSIGHKRGDPQGGAEGQQHKPFSSITLQTAPLLPNGTTWTVDDQAGPGQYLPKRNLPDWAYTHLTYWKGEYGQTALDRPGNLYQDSVSAYSVLDPSFWTSYHTFGLHWVPGDYVRWYIDGHFVYEVNKEALRAQTNSSRYTTSERLIPVEPMFVIFNLAMSSAFSTVDLEQLTFPSQYKVDYVRVYQSPDALNIGCSPPDYPTAQYLACNRDKYLLTEAEQALISGPCMNATSCRQEYSVEYQGGDLLGADGSPLSSPMLKVKDCCDACSNMATCGAYTFNPSTRVCHLKASTGWTKAPVEGMLSGVVYEAAATKPRSTSGGSPPPGGSPPGSSPPGSSPSAPPGSRSLPSPPPAGPSSSAVVGVAAWKAATALLMILVCLLL